MELIYLYQTCVIILLFNFKCTLCRESTCKCDNIRAVLTKEIFDLKLQNMDLVSRLEQIELEVQGNTPTEGLTRSSESELFLALENRISSIESTLLERAKVSRKVLELNKLVRKAIRSEKIQRRQTEIKVTGYLNKINETVKDFKKNIDDKFDTYLKGVDGQMDRYKEQLSKNISLIEKEVQSVHTAVTTLENRTEKKIETRLSALENNVEAISTEVVNIGGDVKAVIDTVLLGQEATCVPHCTNGGVCYKENNCRCRLLTEGDRCEKFICDEDCYKNGGECAGPGQCECPEGRSGINCEKVSCDIPQNVPKSISSKKTYGIGDTISDFVCENGYILSSDEGMTCLDDGTWSNIVECVKAAVYLIRVKTGNVTFAGSDANVYIYLHGPKGKTDRIYLSGGFESDDVDETRVTAKDVRPITGVVVGHDGKGLSSDWFLDFVSIYVENMNEYYVFKSNTSVWVLESDNVYLPSQDACIHTFDIRHNWSPKWFQLTRGNYFLFSRRMSLELCHQKCIEQTAIRCVSVLYNKLYEYCHGFTVSTQSYFDSTVKKSDWQFYVRSCKKIA